MRGLRLLLTGPWMLFLCRTASAAVAEWASNPNCTLKVLFLTYAEPSPKDELFAQGFKFWVEYTDKLRDRYPVEGSLLACLRLEVHFDNLVPEEGLEFNRETLFVSSDSVAPEVIEKIELQVQGWVAQGIRFVILGVGFEDCTITRGYLKVAGLHHIALNVRDWAMFRRQSSQRTWSLGNSDFAALSYFLDLTANPDNTNSVCLISDESDIGSTFVEHMFDIESAYQEAGVLIDLRHHAHPSEGHLFDPLRWAADIADSGCSTLIAFLGTDSNAAILQQELARLQAPLTAEFIWPELNTTAWKELGRMGEQVFSATAWHPEAFAYDYDPYFGSNAHFVELYREWLLLTLGEDRVPTTPEVISVAAGEIIVGVCHAIWFGHNFTTFDQPPPSEFVFALSIGEDQFGTRVADTLRAGGGLTVFGKVSFDPTGVNVGKEFVTIQYVADAAVALVHPLLGRSAPAILPMDSFEARTGCPPGTYFDSPLPANIDTVLTHHGISCPKCSGAQYQDRFNQTKCLACLLGEVSEEGATSCQQCPPGYYRDESQDECTPCGVGAFSRSSGATQCERCPVGRWANQSGLSECEVCPPGTFAPELGRKTECLPCDSGFSTNNQAEQATCTQCARNSYAEGLGNPSCVDCPETFETESIASDNRSRCLCPPNSYWRQASPDTERVPDSEPFCERRHCGEALQCKGWSTEAPSAKAGFSVGPPLYTGGEPSYIVRCASTQDCPGDLDPGFCPQGHEDARSCAECAEGYGRRRLGVGGCFKCQGVEWYEPVLVILLAAGLLAVVLYGLRFTENNVPAETRVKTTAVTGIVLTALQILNVFRFIQVDWPQPIGLFHDTYGTLTHPFEVFSSLGCSLSIDSPLQDYLLLISAWPAAALLIFILLKIVAVFSMYYRNRVSNIHILHMEGMLALLFYTSISMFSLIPWQCESNPDGTSSVVAYRQVLCWSGGAHAAMIAVSCVAILFFIVGFMSLIAWATYQYPIKVTRPKGVKFLLRFRWIFNRFEPDKYYYGLIYCSRNLLVTVLPVIFVNNVPVQFLLVASILQFSVIFQCWNKPWLTDLANKFDAASTVLLILLLIVGSLLISTDAEELATILSLFVGAIFSVFGMALVAALAHNLYLQLSPHKEFTFFLCHHNGGAAVLARWVKIELQLRHQGRVYLDSDELKRLDRLFNVVGYETQNLVVLLTKETLSRIWCAGEITTALRNGVRVICIACNDYEEPTDDFIRDLGKIWTDAQVAEVSRQGVSLEQIQEAFVRFRDLLKIKHDRGASFGQQMKLIDTLIARGRGDNINDPNSHVTAEEASIATRSGKGVKIGNGMFSLPSVTPKASDPQRNLLVGDLDDPEAFLVSRVLQVQLQQVLQSGVSVASRRIPEALEQLEALRPSFLIALLTARALSRPVFAVILARVCTWQDPPDFVPVVADGSFAFPGPAFWEDLERGRVLDPQVLQEHQTSVEDVMRAYKALFVVISKRFSSHGSEKIQWTEVKEMADLWLFSRAHTSHDQAGRSFRTPEHEAPRIFDFRR